ncbi:acyl-CoA thioesterase [Cytobacillus purgationiresistens]|uniref:Acyl-CoA thioester hydrolase n=1 Tax=Cytobacillus purgationiresistens TaxID=863449 RepID=A0ABU0AEU3_9BACI|nr:thioesterase family protein [Cytobacillus purgationiresistens]MDQ0269777.1 acyl-CoA thioester hydrolase [Cytobacillus purgationiresistens]
MSSSHEIDVFVRFSETDAVGHVNNTSYFLYFEEARTKFFHQVFPERNSAFSMILASIKCDYIEPAYAGQTLHVVTEVSDIGNKSFSLSHILTETGSGKVIAKASCVTVCFNFIEQKSIQIPEKLKENLERYAPLQQS